MWNKPKLKPDKETTKKMLALAVKQDVKYVLEHHVYEADDKYYRQRVGGAIGQKLTGTLATIRTRKFVRKFKELCNKVNENSMNPSINIVPKVLQLYVDDTDTITKRLPVGARFDVEHLKIVVQDETDQVNSEEDVPHDAKLSKIYQTLADSIYKDLKFTTDYPSKNENGRIPILDTEMCIEDHEERSVVRYTFYEKKMVPNKVIEEDSAMPWQMKKSILISEGLRRMLRCSKDCPYEEKKEHLRKFSWKMMNSGYAKNQVNYIVNESIKKYEKMVTEEEEGIRPLHRDANWKRKEREKEKIKKTEGWYKDEEKGYDAPLFVPWTDNSIFKKNCEEILDRLGLKIKVVEKTGKKIKHLLQKSSIGMNKGCPTGCVVCNTENRISCLTSDVTYKITCPACGTPPVPVKPIKTAYKGETGRMAKTRAEEHMKKLQKKDEESALWQHAKQYHAGIVPKYDFKITGSYIKKPLQRQLMEAVQIENGDTDLLLNSKNEWMLPLSIGVRLERGGTAIN